MGCISLIFTLLEGYSKNKVISWYGFIKGVFLNFPISYIYFFFLSIFYMKKQKHHRASAVILRSHASINTQTPRHLLSPPPPEGPPLSLGSL